MGMLRVEPESYARIPVKKIKIGPLGFVFLFVWSKKKKKSKKQSHFPRVDEAHRKLNRDPSVSASELR